MEQSLAFFTQIAQRALDEYDLVAPEITFIQRSENVTFKVNTPSGTDYLLRIHVPLTSAMGKHGKDPTAIRSEMLWLDALRRNNMPVQRPIRNRTGHMVTSLDGLNCSLLEWLEGEIYTREMETEDTAAQIGLLAGKLHLHSSRWRIPHGFTRPARNEAYFDEMLATLSRATDDGRIAYRDFKTLETSVNLLKNLMAGIRKTRRSNGLLHGDLHKGNMLYHNGEIKLIDFSFASMGNYMFDLGICLSDMRAGLRPIFLVNYDRLFPLPRNYPRLIEGFFVGSFVGTFAHWVDNPDAQEILVQRVPYIASEYAARFNRDERFWFEA
jgi:Ser/Thr protein kinase RdoA (MazF antagonist)